MSSGFFDGGAAVGGRKPNTSSMYISIRRSLLPDWARIQVMSFDRISVTTNCRSSSERCARVMTAQRGRPSLVRVMASMSIAGPSVQAAKLGDAMTPFSRIASFMRSSEGKNWSISNTPSLRIGGFITCPTSVARSRSRPSDQECSIRFDNRMCSRLDSGSAVMPTRVRMLVTKPSISSRTSSMSETSSGAASEPITFMGQPAEEPGV